MIANWNFHLFEEKNAYLIYDIFMFDNVVLFLLKVLLLITIQQT